MHKRLFPGLQQLPEQQASANTATQPPNLAAEHSRILQKGEPARQDSDVDTFMKKFALSIAGGEKKTALQQLHGALLSIPLLVHLQHVLTM